MQTAHHIQMVKSNTNSLVSNWISCFAYFLCWFSNYLHTTKLWHRNVHLEQGQPNDLRVSFQFCSFFSLSLPKNVNKTIARSKIDTWFFLSKCVHFKTLRMQNRLLCMNATSPYHSTRPTLSACIFINALLNGVQLYSEYTRTIFPYTFLLPTMPNNIQPKLCFRYAYSANEHESSVKFVYECRTHTVCSVLTVTVYQYTANICMQPTHTHERTHVHKRQKKGYEWKQATNWTTPTETTHKRW